MKLKNYTLLELGEFINSGEYLNDEVVPITPLRVFSQQKNTKASESDVVLTIAFSADNHIVGYIGALPDIVDDVRCAWNSCWWVKPGAGADVSMKLFVIFLSNWDRKVLFSEMTPLTASIIQSLGFCTHRTIVGFRGYCRFSLAEVLPRKKMVFKKIRGLLSTVDFLLNILLRIRDYFSRNLHHLDIEFGKTNLLNSSDEDFIQQLNQNQPGKRLAADFNWIGQNPWVVLQNEANEKVSKGYYFSYAVDRFSSEWVRFMKNGKLVALVNFTIKNSELKLPYVFCLSDAAQIVAEYSMQLLKIDRNLSTITVFHQGVVAVLAERKEFVFKTSLPKYSAISNELLKKTSFPNFELQMGDGDCVFT